MDDGPDNFDFKLVNEFKSYNSAIDPTNCAPNLFVRGSQNVYKKISGTIANRFGRKQYDPVDSTLAPVKSTFTWKNSLGTTLPMRVANGSLSVYFNSSWVNLLTGLTLTRWCFDSWWDDTYKKDVLLGVKGDHVIHRWSGGIGVLAATSNASGIIATIDQPYSFADLDSGGTDYVVGDILTLTSGNGQATVYVDAVSPGGIKTISIQNGGSGYSNGDVISITTTPTNGKKAYLRVTSVGGGGVVTGITISSAGNGYDPYLGATMATSSGVGTGFTVKIDATGNTITQWHIKQNGSTYTTGAYKATTGGTGTGAAVNITAIANYAITLSGNASVSQLGFEGSTGQISVNGTIYNYTASNALGGQSFVGLNADPTGEAVGSIVFQPVLTSNNLPDPTNLPFTNDILQVVNNQVYIGSYQSRLVYISADDSYTDYTVPSTPVAGDPELLTLDSRLRSITVRDGNAFISAGTSDWYQVQFSNITVGTTLVRQTIVQKLPTPILGACLAQEFVQVVNNTIVYLSQDQQIRTLGTYRNIFEPAFPALSQDIFQELQQEDFLGDDNSSVGQLRAIGDYLYLTAPLTGRTYIHQTRTSVDQNGNVVAERLWHAPFVWGISRIEEIDGDTVGYSNSNPQMYYLWDTGQWHDDSPSGDYLAYYSILLMAYQNGGRRQGKINFDKAYYEGYATQGSYMYAANYYDYQGSTNILVRPINDPTSRFSQFEMFTGQIPPSLGDASLGDNPLGDGLSILPDDQATVPKFKVILNFPVVNCFEFGMMVYSSDLDSRWEILAIGTNLAISEQSAVEIQK